MAKYHFTLADEISSHVEWHLEHYPEDKRQVEQYKRDLIPSSTGAYSLAGGINPGSVGDPTERAAMNLVTNAYILQTERCIKAIEHVLERCSPTDLQLIDLVYWKGTYNIEGAALKSNISKTAAYDHINKILCAIAVELGYVSI